ncbi:MAG: SpoIIE family protein phosphatase [Archangium sp.]
MKGLRFNTAQRTRPMEGLSSCGDAVVDLTDGDWRLFAVIDALGHGPDAEKSAKAAVAALEKSAKKQPLAQVFEIVHRSLPGLRGVVMSAMLADRGEVSFAGVGNVEIFAPEGHARPAPAAGTLGSGTYRFRSVGITLAPGQRWVMASDGIKVRDASAIIAKSRTLPPAAAVDALFAQAARGHDDVSVLIIDIEASA